MEDGDIWSGSYESWKWGALGLDRDKWKHTTLYTLLREELHRPMVQLQDGFGLRVEEMQKEVDATCKDLRQSIVTVSALNPKPYKPYKS